MRKEGLRLAAVCSLLLFGIEACHRIDEDRAQTPLSEERGVRSVSPVDPSIGNALEQGVRVPELATEAEQDIDNLWTLFPEEPQRSFRRGREDFQRKKYRTASQNIQKSIIYVKLQSLRASGGTKSALLDSESALRRIAQNVEKGKIDSLARLDATFAATQRAIARLHHEKAKQAYAQGELLAAGVELQAAKDSLGRAAVWTGDHVDPALIDCLDRAGNDGKRLMEGSDRLPAATRKTLSELGAQIDRLDRKAEVEDAWGLFAGETDFYLKQAQRRFEDRDIRGAAGNIRRAGACMALEVFGSSGDAKGILEKEIEALGKTAEEVENGSLTSAKKLQRRFARAQYALARVHKMRAARYYEQHYYVRAVTTLRATVTDLERAVSWEGKEMRSSTARVVQDVKDMSKRMREGLSVKPEEISAAVSDLEKSLARLDTLSVSP